VHVARAGLQIGVDAGADGDERRSHGCFASAMRCSSICDGEVDVEGGVSWTVALEEGFAVVLASEGWDGPLDSDACVESIVNAWISRCHPYF